MFICDLSFLPLIEPTSITYNENSQLLGTNSVWHAILTTSFLRLGKKASYTYSVGKFVTHASMVIGILMGSNSLYLCYNNEFEFSSVKFFHISLTAEISYLKRNGFS